MPLLHIAFTTFFLCTSHNRKVWQGPSVPCSLYRQQNRIRSTTEIISPVDGVEIRHLKLRKWQSDCSIVNRHLKLGKSNLTQWGETSVLAKFVASAY